MPVTYRIDPNEQIVHLTTTKKESFEEWKDAVSAALADPSYRRGFNFLSDRRLQAAAPSTQFLREATLFLVTRAGEMGRFRWASVLPGEAPFGMSRMFSILAENHGIEAEAFGDFKEARGWILSRPSRHSPGAPPRAFQ